MNNTESEMWNTWDGINSGLDVDEEKNTKLEDINFIQNET